MKPITIQSITCALFASVSLHSCCCDVSGIDRRALVHALYMHTKPPRDDAIATTPLSEAQLTSAAARGRIDSLNGRTMNIEFSASDTINTESYNQANGAGLAERIIKLARIRSRAIRSLRREPTYCDLLCGLLREYLLGSD